MREYKKYKVCLSIPTVEYTVEAESEDLAIDYALENFADYDFILKFLTCEVVPEEA